MDVFCRNVIITLITFLSSFRSEVVDGTDKIDMLRFGTKTAYRHLQTALTGDLEYLMTDSCQLVQVNMLLRHGSRYPNKKGALKIKNAIDKIKRHTNHVPSYVPLDSHMMLSEMGREEHAGIASRLADVIPGLFTSEQSHNNVLVMSSSKSRAYDSSQAFIKSFQSSINKPLNVTHTINDDITRFFDKCKRYVNSVDKNATASREYHEFMNGPEMKEVVSRVTGRLGIDQGHDVDVGDIYALYLACAYDAGLHDNTEWCHLFAQEDLEVLEYVGDLKKYWLQSSGYTINYKQSCPVFSDFMNHLEEAVTFHDQPDRYTKAALRFGHAETLIPFLTHLGLYDDGHLTASNFRQMKNRSFRMSDISPMAGNVLVVLHRCAKPVTSDIDPDGFYVQLYVNEKRIKFPLCTTELCSWTSFKEAYVHHRKCHFESLCDNDIIHDEL